MPDRANVSSTEVLESFRQALIIFKGKASQAISQVDDEIRRTRVWLQTEHRVSLLAEMKKRQRALAQAEAELFSARMSKLLDDTSAQQMGVRKARRAVDETDKKLTATKSWIRNYDSKVETMGKRLEGFRFSLDSDMPKAIATLSELQKSLERYAEVQRPAGAAEKAPPSEAAAESPDNSPSR